MGQGIAPTHPLHHMTRCYPLVVDRANIGGGGAKGGVQRQALVFDAKREYMTKMGHRKGGARSWPIRMSSKNLYLCNV